MSAKYKLVKSPPASQKEGESSMHARIVPQATVKINQLCEEISTMSSFSPGDIKGMLESFSLLLGRHLDGGSNVELDGIGYFSVSLSCPPNVTSESQIRAKSIKFKNVNFRCSTMLKRRLKTMKLEKATPVKKELFTPEQRQNRILSYFRENRTLTTSYCMAINQTNRHVALADLKLLIEAGKVERLGKGRSVLYILTT